MISKKITNYIHNNLIFSIILALIVGGFISALALSATLSHKSSLQQNSFTQSTYSSIISNSSKTKSKIPEITNFVEVSKIELPTVPKSYTNSYFPDLQINYDSSWKLERKNEENSYLKGLYDKTIKLTKPNQELIISLLPNSDDGNGLACMGIFPILYNSYESINVTDLLFRSTGILDSERSKNAPRSTPQFISFYMSKKPDPCIESFKVKTSIDAKSILSQNEAKSIEKLERAIKYNNNEVSYVVSIEAGVDKPNFNEIDEIIKSSKF